MEPNVAAALARDLTIDIVTTGRKSGRKRRTEIWFHRIEGRYFITGMPGRRDWNDEPREGAALPLLH